MLNNYANSSRLKITVWILLFLSSLFFLTSLYEREITFDDAFFAEQSYWYQKNGYVKTELFKGVLNWNERSFVYHKLHVWQGALLIKTAGWNPYLFKSLPILYLFLFIFLSRFYFNNFITKDRTVYFYFLFLLFIHTFIAQYVFEFRPEIMIMSVGFGSFLGIRSGLDRNNMSLIALAGILAGSAALFHLNGLVFIVAGLGLLLFNKSYRSVLVFGITSALTFSLYLLELVPGDNLSQFVFEFRNYPAMTEDEFSILGWIFKFVTGPKRFFSHVYEASFTLLFLFALIANWKNILHTNELKQALLYLLLLEISLSVISPDSKTMYLTYHIPYMLIVIASTLYSTLAQNRTSKALFVLLFLYAVTHIGHTHRVSSKKNIAMLDVHDTIVEKYGINKNDKVLAPELFVFNAIHNATIQGFASVSMGATGEQVFSNLENLLDFAHKNDKDIVIAGDKIIEKVGADRLTVGTVYNHYQLVGVETGLHVFRNINESMDTNRIYGSDLHN